MGYSNDFGRRSLDDNFSACRLQACQCRAAGSVATIREVIGQARGQTSVHVGVVADSRPSIALRHIDKQLFD